MTLLNLCNLKSSNQFYNIKFHTIDHDKVEENLTFLLHQYSEKLVDLIRRMLMIDPSNRPNFI